MSAPKSIAIIIASTRTPRVGPNVVKFIKQTIETKADTSDVALTVVDLADFKLPVFDEPAVPASVLDPANYKHEHSIKWGTEIAKHDGYVFVSPEYNFGMPGGVKNAVDYVYHEWKGKPIAVFTYGILGGSSASEQLQHVLKNVGLQVSTGALISSPHRGSIIPVVQVCGPPEIPD